MAVRLTKDHRRGSAERFDSCGATDSHLSSRVGLNTTCSPGNAGGGSTPSRSSRRGSQMNLRGHGHTSSSVATALRGTGTHSHGRASKQPLSNSNARNTTDAPAAAASRSKHRDYNTRHRSTFQQDHRAEATGKHLRHDSGRRGGIKNGAAATSSTTAPETLPGRADAKSCSPFHLCCGGGKTKIPNGAYFGMGMLLACVFVYALAPWQQFISPSGRAGVLGAAREDGGGVGLRRGGGAGAGGERPLGGGPGTSCSGERRGGQSRKFLEQEVEQRGLQEDDVAGTRMTSVVPDIDGTAATPGDQPVLKKAHSHSGVVVYSPQTSPAQGDPMPPRRSLSDLLVLPPHSPLPLNRRAVARCSQVPPLGRGPSASSYTGASTPSSSNCESVSGPCGEAEGQLTPAGAPNRPTPTTDRPREHAQNSRRRSGPQYGIDSAASSVASNPQLRTPDFGPASRSTPHFGYSASPTPVSLLGGGTTGPSEDGDQAANPEDPYSLEAATGHAWSSEGSGAVSVFRMPGPAQPTSDGPGRSDEGPLDGGTGEQAPGGEDEQRSRSHPASRATTLYTHTDTADHGEQAVVGARVNVDGESPRSAHPSASPVVAVTTSTPLQDDHHVVDLEAEKLHVYKDGAEQEHEENRAQNSLEMEEVLQCEAAAASRGRGDKTGVDQEQEGKQEKISQRLQQETGETPPATKETAAAPVQPEGEEGAIAEEGDGAFDRRREGEG